MIEIFVGVVVLGLTVIVIYTVSVGLLAAWLFLPETHPRAARVVARLLRWACLLAICYAVGAWVMAWHGSR